MSSGRVTIHSETANGGQGPLPVQPVAPAPTPGSIVARLRERARAQQTTRTIEMPVGGEFGDRLYIKYGVLNPDDMDRFVATRQGVNLKDISATAVTMDMMARACQCLIGKYEGESEVLSDELGVVKLEDRLAKLLDLRSPEEPALTSYEVIKRLFGRNGAAITSHGDDLATWMTDPASTETDAAGEYSGVDG
jgi:hypothetical protein